jgi:hypothetical protein
MQLELLLFIHLFIFLLYYFISLSNDINFKILI